MGETWEDRFDMAISLAELGVDSIPINALTPIPGTPLEHQPILSADDILRTVAMFRFTAPTADIRMAAGRCIIENSGAAAFLSGANSAITAQLTEICQCWLILDLKYKKRGFAKQNLFFVIHYLLKIHNINPFQQELPLLRSAFNGLTCRNNRQTFLDPLSGSV